MCITCPICDAPELATPERLNIRALKVCDTKGHWWSECLLCKETYGNGWFSIYDEDGNEVVEIDPLTAAQLVGEGREVELRET